MAKKQRQRSREVPLHRSCGTMASHMLLLETHRSYRATLERLESATTRRRELAAPDKAIPVVTIKTVVNVVYKTDEQNVSDAKIASQMKALSRDFYRVSAHDGHGFWAQLPGQSADAPATTRACRAGRGRRQY